MTISIFQRGTDGWCWSVQIGIRRYESIDGYISDFDALDGALDWVKQNMNERSV